MRLGSAEVFGEAEQRRFGVGLIAGPNAGIPVVIARDGENRSGIVLVGFIELRAVQLALPVEIDDVSDVIEECGLVGLRRRFDLMLHRFGDRPLNIIAMDSTGIADDVKDESSGLRGCVRLFRNDHTQRKREIHIVGDRRLFEVRIVFRVRNGFEKRTSVFREMTLSFCRIWFEVVHGHGNPPDIAAGRGDHSLAEHPQINGDPVYNP